MTDSTRPLRVLLLATVVLVGWLVRPFADALIVAAVVVVLAWPFHHRLLRLTHERRALATGLSVVAVTLGVVLPVVGLFLLVSRELAALANQVAVELDRGDLATFITSMQRVPLLAWLVGQVGGADALTVELRGASRDTVADIARAIGQSVPDLVGRTARLVLKVTVFELALSTLFYRGEALLMWLTRLSPLRPAHTQRLLKVFSDFARKVVTAGLVAAVVQGLVAGLGYLLVGIERPILLAFLTGVLSFVPVVGTAAAWVPVTLILLLQGHTIGALVVTLWSILLTGTVDNIVKPLVVRGHGDMPALLVFLGVFGGLAAFGVVGLLVGPVLMAVLLALLRFYEESLEGG